MNITFQSVHFKASSHLEEFVMEKVSKLFDQNDKIIRADVTLFEGASGNPRNQFCEIILSLPGENKFVKKNSSSYEESVLKTVATLQKTLGRDSINKISRRRKISLN
jgi:ribosome-associated translation inhibitor RaiA